MDAKNIPREEDKVEVKFLNLLALEEIGGWGTWSPPFGRPRVGIRRKVEEVHSRETSLCTTRTNQQLHSTSTTVWWPVPLEGLTFEL